MKVVILTHTCPRFRGDQTAAFMKGLGNGFVAANLETWMLTPWDPAFQQDSERRYTVITYRYIWPPRWQILGYSRTLVNDMRIRISATLLAPFLILLGILNLWRIVVRHRIDVINAHWIVPNGFIGAIVSKLTGAKLVPTLPGSDVFLAQHNPLYNWMARVAARQASAITTNSPQLGQDLVTLGADSQKITPIIYGVDPNEIYPDEKGVAAKRRALDVKPDELMILAVGRLVAKKGFRYLIEAMSAVLEAVPNAKCVIIGDGDQRAELEALVARYHLEGKVVMPGSVSRTELRVLYNACDLFSLPSIRDDAGNLDDQSVSLIEAMACRKPVLATNFPGYRLVIEPGWNGVLTPERDVPAVAQGMIDILKHPKRRAAMGQRNLELVLSKFTWLKIAEYYKAVFARITA